MGITGLIPFLEKASSKLHLNDIRGSTVAVDTYCWLHKGAFSCAEKLARGEDTDLYVQYCLKYVYMLLSFNIKPILVFDGQHLPAKLLTEQRRRESRMNSKKRAAELLRLGQIDEARSQMRRCIDITHEMALRLIKECRLRNVDCIVAPYEADAQLAWLNKAGIADYIVTEDSDLTLFGAQKIIFKLDLAGCGLLIEAQKFFLAMGCQEQKYNFDKFRRMCILSGCDYLDSLPGIGLVKACKFILKTDQTDMCLALKKIPGYLNMRNLKIEETYIDNFMKAEATFKHMFIYNPLKRRMERLYPLTEFKTDEKYCCNAGSLLLNNEQALHLALGNLHPFTLKLLDNWMPENAITLQAAFSKHVKRSNHKSIWHIDYKLHEQHQHAQKTTQSEQSIRSCALYFKKVDYLTKSIEGELKCNRLEAEEKPSEAEILSMYTSDLKRKRFSTDDESIEEAQTEEHRTSSHNPFAKEKRDPNLQCSPIVCTNGSLLRALSPKKPNQPLLNNHSIFVTEKIEIRSHLFASLTPEISKVNIDRFDKVIETKAEPLAHSTAEPTYNMVLKDIAEVNLLEDKTIVLSSSDESSASASTQLNSQDSTSTTESSELGVLNFQIKAARRVGLPKSKAVRKVRNNKISSGLSQNQTNLSMFGFQKRPTLK